MHCGCPIFLLLKGMPRISERWHAHAKHFNYSHVFAVKAESLPAITDRYDSHLAINLSQVTNITILLPP